MQYDHYKYEEFEGDIYLGTKTETLDLMGKSMSDT